MSSKVDRKLHLQDMADLTATVQRCLRKAEKKLARRGHWLQRAAFFRNFLNYHQRDCPICQQQKARQG